MMKRPHALLPALGLALAAFIFSACSKTEADAASVTVYKSPTCGCCSKWVEHLQENGFEVETKEMQDVTPMKDRFGVPGTMRSCHTAIVQGYIIEGHVPAADIRRLLAEQPDVTGLAVPGMPMGSPGMEGTRKDAYEVIAFKKNGGQSVFARR